MDGWIDGSRPPQAAKHKRELEVCLSEFEDERTALSEQYAIDLSNAKKAAVCRWSLDVVP